jgi:hypothetical protein
MTVFLYKDKKNDRDSVKYIDLSRLGKLECGHYFPSIDIIGPAFSVSFDFDNDSYDDITTVLTRNEFNTLKKYNDKINKLGYGIEIGDSRHKLGLKYYSVIKPVLTKLTSKENDKLTAILKKQEEEHIITKYNLSQKDMIFINEKYMYSEYFDRGRIAYIYEDFEDYKQEYFASTGINIRSHISLSENLLELDDGRIVDFHY